MSWETVGRPIGAAFALIGFALHATARVEVEGEAPSGAAVFAHWHRHVPFLLGHHGQRGRWMIVGDAPHLAAMRRWTELSGSPVATISRDTASATLDRLADVLRRGGSVALAVDGPRGPAFVAKRGCVELAKRGGVPIVPVGYACKRGVTMKSRWDRSLVPSLFDVVTVKYGDWIDAEDSRALDQVGQALDRLDTSHR